MTDQPTPKQYAMRLSAKAPLEWTAEHEAILRAIDTLWDDLRALWIQCRREQEIAEDARGDPELLTARAALSRAESRVNEAFAARRAWRQRERRGGSTPELEAEIRAAIAERSHAREVLAPALRRVRREIRDPLLEIGSERDRQMRSIAQGRGRRYPELHDGVYNDLLKRFRTAANLAAKIGRVPRPAREHPSRSIYVQLKARSLGGEMVDQYTKDGRKLAKRKNVGGTLVGHTWQHLQRRTHGVRLEPYGKRAEGPVLLLVMPVDAYGLEVRVPIYAEQVPPSGALLKGVRIVRTESAEQRDRWHVVFSVQSEQHMRPIAKGSDGTLYAGVNWRLTLAGWRVLDGVTSETGERIQIHMPTELLARAAYGDLLQSALDRRANEIVGKLGDDAQTLLCRRDWESLRRRSQESGDAELRLWSDGTAPKKPHEALLQARKRSRYDPEKQADIVAEALGDRRGRWWLEQHRRRTLCQRKDLYRKCARWIAERTGRIVLAQLNGRRLARICDPETGQETELPLPARRARQYTAPSELISALRWAARKTGIEVVDQSAVDLSHACPLCGEEMERTKDDRSSLHLRCSQHGLWDRDQALALGLWRDDPAAADRERWVWHAQTEQRSRARIVNVVEEVQGKVRGHGRAWSRLRYTSGTALAESENS